MNVQLLRFFGFCLIFVGIILTSVIVGGYSSLHRSENRIESSKELLFKACQNKLDLLPKLLDGVKESEHKEILIELKQISKETSNILHHAVFQKSSMDNTLILKFETSQSILTKELVKLFLKLNQSKNKSDIELLKIIKEYFFSAQDKVYDAKIRYNKEVQYFNTRTKIFPGFLIAKLFGFNKSVYFGLSEDSFLDADKTFH